MSSLLRRYISEILSEMESNPAVGSEIIFNDKKVINPRTLDAAEKEKEDNDPDKKSKSNKDEMSVAANIAGPTAPLRASSADVGANPTKPGQKLKKKKNKTDFVRWK